MQRESSSPKMQKVALCLVQHPVVGFAWPPEVSLSSPSKRQALLLRHLPRAAVPGSSLSCWSALWLGAPCLPLWPSDGERSPLSLCQVPLTLNVWGGGVTELVRAGGVDRPGLAYDGVSDLGSGSSSLWSGMQIVRPGDLLSQLFNFSVGYTVWKMVNCYLFEQLCNIGECSY